MKLAAHYNKVSLIITVSVLLIAGIVYFAAISYIANRQLDRDLTEEIEEVRDYIKENQRLPVQVDFDEDVTTFSKIGQQVFPTIFFDTQYYNSKEKKKESGRAVAGTVTYKKENYKVVITVSKESTQFLVQLILIITILLTIVLIVVLSIANRLLLNDLWQPFYKLLNQLKTFDISADPEMAVNHSKVDEFLELNNAMASMTSKAKSDYLHLKSFTENASHEMMTPLAVVNSKLDTLIQDETLNADQLTQITSIYTSMAKLSRLNQSLLLLVRIDNNLIKDDSLINLKVSIEDKLQQFQELMQSKSIVASYHSSDKNIYASKYLIDILLNNLFSNAIRHNYNNGEIEIVLTDTQLTIRNTGQQLPLPEANIFERFQKGKHSEGTGLGLTLVKNICTHYRYKIKYCYADHWHIFTIDF